MKSHALLLSAAALMMASGAKASPVSRDEALKSAREFFAARGCHENITANGQTRTSRAVPGNGITPYYIFNVENDGGYVVISADDRTCTVLAYSDRGSLNEDDMPAPCAMWLSRYASEITSLGDVTADDVTVSHMLNREYSTPVAPLLTSRWDQTAPYNDECPLDDASGKRCVTGCIATALAQVMYYHRHPSRPMGKVSYNDNGVSRSLDFSTIPSFDWENMTDTYDRSSTASQASAVATLMKAAGYGAEMNYSPDTSVAPFNKIGPSLVKYFGYDSRIQSYDRDVMSTYEWAGILLSELYAGRPVIYSGGNQSAIGHTFVCDGYDGNGLFHFNWGWSGMSDGYYRLSALNPGQQSTGGTGNGYNLYNTIVCNIAPEGAVDAAGAQTDYILSVYNLYLGNAEGYVEASKTPSMKTGLDNARLYFRAVNRSLATFSGEVWAAVENEDGSVTPLVRAACPVIAPGDNTQLIFSLFEAGLTDGTYKIGFYYRLPEQDGWHRISSSPTASSECMAIVSDGEVTLKPCVRETTLMLSSANGMSYLTFDRNDSSMQLTVSTVSSLLWNGRLYGFMTGTDNEPEDGCLYAETSLSGRNNRVTLINDGLHPEAGSYYMYFYTDPGRYNLVTMLPVRVTDKQSGICDVTSDPVTGITVSDGYIIISSQAVVESVSLADICGRVHPAETIDCNSGIKVSTKGLAPGVYVVTIHMAGGEHATRKIIVR